MGSVASSADCMPRAESRRRLVSGAVMLCLVARRASGSVAVRPRPGVRALSRFETQGDGSGFDAQRAGVYCGGEAREAYLSSMPGLTAWDRWHEAPRGLENGHAHTIFAAKLRWSASVRYARTLLGTEDGGTLALDVVEAFDESARVRTPDGATYRGPASPERDGAPFLLLLSGLGGGSQDTYVRSMAASGMVSRSTPVEPLCSPPLTLMLAVS